jgi:hypothetical protein
MRFGARANHAADFADLARWRRSPQEASGGGRLASRIARKKNGEAVGKPILFFLYILPMQKDTEELLELLLLASSS